MSGPFEVLVAQKARHVKVKGHFQNINGPSRTIEALKLLEQDSTKPILLDFSSCDVAFPSGVVALCAYAIRRRDEGQHITFALPQEESLARLFVNANWAHLIDPTHFEQSSYRGRSNYATRQYVSSAEQHAVVNDVIDTMLRTVSRMERQDLAALEWAVNEITDNVINHSESPIGGLVQVTYYSKRRRIEYTVADPGIGIPESLRRSPNPPESDLDALDMAIREGVTRDKDFGQGNGLFGSYQISSLSDGDFMLHSGWASLIHNKGSLRTMRNTIQHAGTVVSATVNLAVPNLLERALKMKGQVWVPVDFVETEFELHTDGVVTVRLIEETKSFGSRTAGTPVRIKLGNISRMSPGLRIVVDFAGVPLLSSSFADEVFGKLFVELGPMAFAQRFEFVNLIATSRQLIDKAILQRVNALGG